MPRPSRLTGVPDFSQLPEAEADAQQTWEITRESPQNRTQTSTLNAAIHGDATVYKLVNELRRRAQTYRHSARKGTEQDREARVQLAEALERRADELERQLADIA